MANTGTTQTDDDRYDDDELPPTPAPATPAEWDGLIDEWDEIREGYYLGDAPATVLECAKNLEASVAAGGPDTALWTLGLVLTGPYVIHAHPDPVAEARVSEAMRAVENALGRAACAHEAHPCDDEGGLDAEPDDLRGVLEMLARPERDAHDADLAEEEIRPGGGGDRSWYGGRMTREIWACPRNLAGFARSFSD